MVRDYQRAASKSGRTNVSQDHEMDDTNVSRHQSHNFVKYTTSQTCRGGATTNENSSQRYQFEENEHVLGFCTEDEEQHTQLRTHQVHTAGASKTPAH